MSDEKCSHCGETMRLSNNENYMVCDSSRCSAGKPNATTNEKRYSMTVPGGFVAHYTAAELDLVIKNATSAKAYADRDKTEAERQKSQEAEEALRKRTTRLHAIAAEIKRTMQCNCDLDAWEPEADTGHSWVCRIHKAALAQYAKEQGHE